jgi:hypothetical protein
MGMDVVGLNPTCKEGKYFRRNIWYWNPLAAFITGAAPEICGDTGDEWRKWFFNEGHGLNAENSIRLAARLEEALADGAIEQYLSDLRQHPDCDYERYRDAASPENIREFVTFLRTCGGFRIW